MTTRVASDEKGMFSYLLTSNLSKTSTWWRSGDEKSADQNLEAYFKGLKRSACKVCGVRVTSTCFNCGGKFCLEHMTNHSCGRLLPSDSTGNVTEIGRSPRP